MFYLIEDCPFQVFGIFRLSILIDTSNSSFQFPTAHLIYESKGLLSMLAFKITLDTVPTKKLNELARLLVILLIPNLIYRHTDLSFR